MVQPVKYMCVIVLIEADRSEHVFEGECRGRVATASAGDGGFGYDPIFFLPEKKRTIAQLSEDEKNAISHRGQAVRKLVRYLMD